MERSFSEALKQRRTYYSITNQSPISDQEIDVYKRQVIGCYILLLPLVVAVVCGVCNYYGKALFRFFTIFFSRCV